MGIRSTRKKHTCSFPFSFLTKDRHTLYTEGHDPSEISVLRLLQKTVFNFELQYKNSDLFFHDIVGTGVFRIIPNLKDQMSSTSVDHALELEIVGVFFDIIHSHARTGFEIVARLKTLLLNKLLILVRANEIIERCNQNSENQAVNLVDFEYITEKISDLCEIEERLLKPQIRRTIDDMSNRNSSAKTPSLFERIKNSKIGSGIFNDEESTIPPPYLDQTPDDDMRIHIHIFNMLILNLKSTLRNQKIAGTPLILEEIYALKDAIYMTSQNISSIIGWLFKEPSDVTSLSEHIHGDRQINYYLKLSMNVQMIVDNGLVWRVSTTFHKLVKNRLFKGMLQRCFGKHTLIRKDMTSFRSDEMFMSMLHIGDLELKLLDDRLLWINLKEEKPAVNHVSFENLQLKSADHVMRWGEFLLLFLEDGADVENTVSKTHAKVLWLPDLLKPGREITLQDTRETFLGFHGLSLHDDNLLTICESASDHGHYLKSFRILHQGEWQLKLEFHGWIDINTILRFGYIDGASPLSALALTESHKPSKLEASNLKLKIKIVSRGFIIQMLKFTGELQVSQQLLYFEGDVKQDTQPLHRGQTLHSSQHIANISHAAQKSVIFEPKILTPRITAIVLLFSNRLEFHMTVLTPRGFQVAMNWKRSEKLLRKWIC